MGGWHQTTDKEVNFFLVVMAILCALCIVGRCTTAVGRGTNELQVEHERHRCP